MFLVQNLHQSRSEQLTNVTDQFELQEKLNDLERNLDNAEADILKLQPDNRHAGRSVSPGPRRRPLSTLLAPDLLQDAIRKAEDLDEALNIYDGQSVELLLSIKSMKLNLTKRSQNRGYLAM